MHVFLILANSLPLLSVELSAFSSAGDDSVMPTTEARDGVGLPRMFRAGTESLKSNGVLPFNNVSDAFDDFHSWEDRDYFLAQEPENARTRPDRHFMPSLLKFDALVSILLL